MWHLVSGAGYQHRGSDSSWCSIFRTPEEQWSQSVDLFPLRSGHGRARPGHRASAASSCSASTVLETGAPGSSASYVRGGNYCLGWCKRLKLAPQRAPFFSDRSLDDVFEPAQVHLSSAQADFCNLLFWKGCYLLQRNWKKIAFWI